MNQNVIALVLICLAVVTHYLDLYLGVPTQNSISIGLLSSGMTLLRINLDEHNRS